jgi:hypothetical protein
MSSFEDLLKKVQKTEKKGRKVDQLTADALEYADLVTEHLTPCSDDLILLTLKGHLVIESLLEIILRRVLSVGRLPQSNGKLGFSQKLQLVQVVVEEREPGPNADLFCAICKLNWLRNQLAHNLKDQGQIENDVKRFIEEYYRKAGAKPTLPKPLPLQLRYCIVQLCMFLHKIRCHFFNLELSEEE